MPSILSRWAWCRAGQNWNPEELSEACAEAGRHAFPLSATPEPFVGGTGAPVAPVAIL